MEAIKEESNDDGTGRSDETIKIIIPVRDDDGGNDDGNDDKCSKNDGCEAIKKDLENEIRKVKNGCADTSRALKKIINNLEGRLTEDFRRLKNNLEEYLKKYCKDKNKIGEEWEDI